MRGRHPTKSPWRCFCRVSSPGCQRRRQRLCLWLGFGCCSAAAGHPGKSRRAAWEFPACPESQHRPDPPPPAPGLRMLPSFGVGLFSEKTKSPSSLLFQAQHPRCVDCTPFMGETVSWAGVRPSVRLQRQDQFTVIFLSHLGAWGKVRSH